jgi:SAM-dependent methyltransferase
MEENARTEWNQRYEQGSHASLDPDPFLVRAYREFVEPRFKYVGRALDLAGGVGRHALYLAERGWLVTLMDISDAALQRARRQAEQQDLHIFAEQADLTVARLPEDAFDLIVVFFYLERSLFPQIAAALRPGGMLIYKTYTTEQQKLSGGPTHPMHLLLSGELKSAFGELEALFYSETVTEKAVADLVARKAEGR